MQTSQTPIESDSLSAKLEQVGRMLRLVGWAGIWIQLGFAIVAGLMLVFAIAGRNFNQAIGTSPFPGVQNIQTATTPGLGIGVFWAVCGIVVLLFTTYLAFRQTQFARRLRNPNPERHPRKSEVLQVLRLGIIAGFVGMALTILGGGATLGVLLSKSIAQPQGVAIYDPTRIIRSLDVFVAMANMVGITAHFVGTVAAIATYGWLHKQ